MHPVNIDWWIFKVRGWEGHWAFLTLVIGFFYQRARSLRVGYSHDWFVKAYFYSILPGFIFARLFHFMFWETELFFSNPMIFFTPYAGGNAILGATIGTGLGGWLVSRATRVNFLHWCDCLMIPIALTLAISRLACFLNGDAYGLPTASWVGVVFSEDSDVFMHEWRKLHALYAVHSDPLGVISQIFGQWGVNLADMPLPHALDHLRAEGVNNLADLTRFYPPQATGDYIAVLQAKGLVPFPVVYPPTHPTQLYEVILLLGIFAFLKFADGKEWARQRHFFIFWTLYGANRLIIEVFRGDRNIAFANLTYAQLISLSLFLFGVAGYVYNTKQWKQSGFPEPVLK